MKVYATDIDDDALATARAGRFTPASLETLTDEQRSTYFEADGDLLRFRSDLRPTLIFGRHDLQQDAPISRVLLLTCRNVLMYFTPEAQARVLERLAFALHEQGLLVLGKAGMLLTQSHLVVVDGRVRLGHGARENGHRPSHDALLRSAALARGPRVVAAVLTGLLDDGAAGLVVVERYGGTCLVQDPGEAEFASMPLAALRAVPAARALPLDDLVQEVVAVAGTTRAPGQRVGPEVRARDEAERDSALGVTPMGAGRRPPGEPSPFACPDCHGVLNTVPDEAVLRFRCRTGHAWSADSLLAQQSTDVEEALWTALRVLEERAEMCGRLAEEAATADRGFLESLYRGRTQEALGTAAVLRDLLQRGAGDGADPDAPAAGAVASSTRPAETGA